MDGQDSDGVKGDHDVGKLLGGGITAIFKNVTAQRSTPSLEEGLPAPKSFCGPHPAQVTHPLLRTYVRLETIV
jgi:hypothetical protein